MVLRDDEPMRRNSPTSKDIVVKDNRELDAERQRLSTLIDRFAAAGPQGCTTHPHFGIQYGVPRTPPHCADALPLDRPRDVGVLDLRVVGKHERFTQDYGQCVVALEGQEYFFVAGHRSALSRHDAKVAVVWFH